jgi:anaerobic magnesium-protoporphyrin IX monomethyl ester cyclase
MTSTRPVLWEQIIRYQTDETPFQACTGIRSSYCHPRDALQPRDTKMKILLVYSLRAGLNPKHPISSLGDIHIGLSYVSASLKSHGHTTRLVVLDSERKQKSLTLLESTLTEFNPKMVAFTAVATQYPFIRSIAQRIKERWPEKYLVLGGVHASLKPEEAIRDVFDAVCVGEGELPAAELARQLASGQSPTGIPNFWIKRPDNTIEKNPTRNFIADLNELPILDREMWHDWVLEKPHRHHVVLPSRGCPYNCAYCCNHALRKVADGKYVRVRPPANIVQEIRTIKQRYPETTDIYLQSETIAVNITWLKELTSLIEEFNKQLKYPVAFATNFRVARQFLTEEVFGTLQRANVRTIEIGLESGSERLRREVLRRHYPNSDFFEAVNLARRYEMAVNVYNMIGFPGETLAEHEETIKVNRQVAPNRSMTSIFFPYPGTDLFETCKTAGLIEEGSTTLERSRATLDIPRFSKRQIQHAYNWFEYRIYRGHRPLHYRIRKFVAKKVTSYAWSNVVFARLLPLWHAIHPR